MCKACKSECPLSVDMATLKAETLHQTHQTRASPYAPASSPPSAPSTAGARPSPPWPTSRPACRRPAASWAWPGPPLPTFTRRTLPRWHHTRPQPGESALPSARVGVSSTPSRRSRPTEPPAPRGTLTWLADSFTSYTEPAVGIAAIELLERAGWRVNLADTGCCGRAAFSKGLLDKARKQATGLVEALRRTQGPIVGAEPSCLLTLRDEHRALLGADHPGVAEVAGRAVLVEELLVEAIDDGSLRLREDAWPAGARILFHGHCHQKAEVGTAATVALLRRIPGAEVVELDAGCCGMAGSFGFEAEHYETSMRIGENRLFPAVRAEPPDTLVAATGVSCRQQIDHGTTRRAHHPVELIRAALP